MIMQRMSRWGQVVISIGILVWGSQGLQGCTWPGGNSLVETRMYPPEKKYDSPVEGISYYLPKRLVKVTVSRERVDLDRVKKAKEALAKAKTAEEGANKAFLEAKKSKQFTEELAKNAKDPGLEEAKKLAALGAAEEIVRKKLLDEAKKQVKQAERDLAKATLQEEVVLRGKEELRLQYVKALEQQSKVAQELKDIEESLLTLEMLGREIPTHGKRTELNKEMLKLEEKKNEKNKELNGLKKLNESLAQKVAEANIIANLNVTGGKSAYFEDKITIEPQPLIADTLTLYVAKINHSVMREDVLKLGTTPTGLLQTAEGQADDQTGQIIQALGQLALKGTVLTIPSSSSFAEYAAAQEDIPIYKPAKTVCHADLPVDEEFPEIRVTPFTTEFLVDPAKTQEIKTMNESLCRLGTKFKIVVKPVEVKSALREQEGYGCEGNPCSIPGLVYRRPHTHTLEVRERHRVFPLSLFKFLEEFEKSRTNWGKIPPEEWGSTPGTREFKARVTYHEENLKRIQVKTGYDEKFNDRFTSVQKSLTLDLPNGAPIFVLPMEPGVFVKTNYVFGFENGMLTKYEGTQPSQVHGLVKLPLALVEDAFASVGELIKLKVDYSSKEVQQAENEKKLLELQNDIDKLSVNNDAADRLKDKADYAEQLLKLQKTLGELKKLSTDSPSSVP